MQRVGILNARTYGRKPYSRHIPLEISQEQSMSTHHLPSYDGQRGEKGTWLQCQGSDSELEPCPLSNHLGICLTLPTKIIPTSLARMPSYEWKRKSGIHQHSIQFTVHSLTHTQTTSPLFQSYRGPRNTKMRGSCWYSSCAGRQQSLTYHLPVHTAQPGLAQCSRLVTSVQTLLLPKKCRQGVSPLSLNQTKTQLNQVRPVLFYPNTNLPSGDVIM